MTLPEPDGTEEDEAATARIARVADLIAARAAERPDALALMSVSSAVEEMLRYESPSQHTGWRNNLGLRGVTSLRVAF